MILPTDSQPPMIRPPRERALPGIHDAVFSYIRASGLERSAAILDCGAGTGAWLERLHRAGFDNLLAIGIDAADYVGSAPFLRADLDEDFGSRLHPRRFDLITALEVIEHLESLCHFLRQCGSLLASSGRLLLTTPNVECIPGRLKFLKSGALRWFDEAGDDAHISPIFGALLAKMAERTGFAIEMRAPVPGPGWNGTAAWKLPLCGLLSRLLYGNVGGDCHFFVLRPEPAEGPPLAPSEPAITPSP